MNNRQNHQPKTSGIFVDQLRKVGRELTAKVIGLPYDHVRQVPLALIEFPNSGNKVHILQPEGLQIGDTVIASSKQLKEVKPGNSTLLRNLPVGTIVHGVNGQLARSAGQFAKIIAIEGEVAELELSSGQTKRLSVNNWATVGKVGPRKPIQSHYHKHRFPRHFRPV
ncbi:MAG: hypothetical protein EBX50_20855 [Chitinophagia bacterium]|nr:hypothetical protein [Chitinophagia bacterium]